MTTEKACQTTFDLNSHRMQYRRIQQAPSFHSNMQAAIPTRTWLLPISSKKVLDLYWNDVALFLWALVLPLSQVGSVSFRLFINKQCICHLSNSLRFSDWNPICRKRLTM